ncbi:3-oxoacyl-ACP reductase [Acrocarpospora corrugata]|uniref:3-oxoacyl-ACP reductase n=1 Tax=Acrocarpospora corrugata TaxID=35763 RepID=A0A5M3VPI6_9ACTN|nr:3-oxoacyl-ACP reductase [Acrocarpospora corrugata]
MITGASQGIGAGLVEAFRKLGYGVVATSRTITPATDPDMVIVQGDIADADTADRVVAAALSRFGRIDTLVNNAGVFIAKPFTDYTDDDFAAMIGVNLAGFFHLTRRALRPMLDQGNGHIVNITTSLVDNPSSTVPSVLASLTKGGLTAATRSMAVEYAKRGVRVNAVSPGIIATPMHAADDHETLAALHPLGRIGETGDIVDGVLYLESAPFVTGEILHIDGGQSAGH